jgi:hypothetical protein
MWFSDEKCKPDHDSHIALTGPAFSLSRGRNFGAGLEATDPLSARECNSVGWRYAAAAERTGLRELTFKESYLLALYFIWSYTADGDHA